MEQKGEIGILRTEAGTWSRAGSRDLHRVSMFGA